MRGMYIWNVFGQNLFDPFSLEVISTRWQPLSHPCRSNWMWSVSQTLPSPPACLWCLGEDCGLQCRWRAWTSCDTETAGWWSQCHSGGAHTLPTSFPGSLRNRRCPAHLRTWGPPLPITWLCLSATPTPAVTPATPCICATFVTTCPWPSVVCSTAGSLVTCPCTVYAGCPLCSMDSAKWAMPWLWSHLKVLKSRSLSCIVLSAEMDLSSGTGVWSSSPLLLLNSKHFCQNLNWSFQGYGHIETQLHFSKKCSFDLIVLSTADLWSYKSSVWGCCLFYWCCCCMSLFAIPEWLNVSTEGSVQPWRKKSPK